MFCLLEENVSQVGLALKYVYVNSRKVDTDSGAVEQTDQNQWNFLPTMLLFRTKFLTELQPDVRSGPNDRPSVRTKFFENREFSHVASGPILLGVLLLQL